MADFSNIIQEINSNLPDNTEQFITPKKLRDTMVDLTEAVEDELDNVADDLIVDDLTTESASKALSAKQGFVLNSQLTRLSVKQNILDNEVSNIETSLSYISDKTNPIEYDGAYIEITAPTIVPSLYIGNIDISNIGTSLYVQDIRVGQYDVASELEALNNKMVKCTQAQYDDWSQSGMIDANKFYFIIEQASAQASLTNTDNESI